MRKILTQILLISIIILGLGNINQTNAGELGGFESIFSEVNNDFNCSDINYDIKKYYSSYKYKVDKIFKNLSRKNSGFQKNIYANLIKKTNILIKKIDKNKNKKNYTIISYIKCESEKKLEKFNKVNLEKKGCNIGDSWKYSFMYSGTSTQKNDYRNAYYKVNCNNYGKAKIINFERCENGYEVSSDKVYIFGQKTNYCQKKKIGNRCYGKTENRSDYGKYTDVGISRLKKYSKEYNTNSWFYVECMANGRQEVKKFLYCEEEGCNVGYDVKGSLVGVPENTFSYYINNNGVLKYALNSDHFDFVFNKGEKIDKVYALNKELYITTLSDKGKKIYWIYQEKGSVYYSYYKYSKNGDLGNLVYFSINSDNIKYILTIDKKRKKSLFLRLGENFNLVKTIEKNNGLYFISRNKNIFREDFLNVKTWIFYKKRFGLKETNSVIGEFYRYYISYNGNKETIHFTILGKQTDSYSYYVDNNDSAIENIELLGNNYVSYKVRDNYFIYSIKNSSMIFTGSEGEFKNFKRNKIN